MLVLRDVSKRFGGISAVENVSLEFPSGKICGLIGPNGAGKTTLFNVITGMSAPSGGTVNYRGSDITGLPPHRIARRGIGRTFQQVRIFQQLRVLDNAVVALPEVSDRIGAALLHTAKARRALAERALNHLRFVGLAERAQSFGADLGYAEQKLLMFACLLCSGAETLLLDEPTAGLDPTSRAPVLDAIIRLRDAGKSVVLIEHNLDVVRGCCEDVVFLAQGRVVTRGTVDEVERDPALGEMYFGTAGQRRD
jgi:branched-chain amino acid transport system permease protein